MPAVIYGRAGKVDSATAICQFCDTDFVGTDGTLGGKYTTAEDLADMIKSQWPAHDDKFRLVVITGGEPLLQLDTALINALHERKFKIAVETNGSVAAPAVIARKTRNGGCRCRRIK